MENYLEVREFDSITSNPEFAQDSNYKYLPRSVFDQLIIFIHEFSGDESHADALDFMRISYKRNVGEVVTIQNYVGLIQLDSGYQIEVLPKISQSDPSETKRIFLKMLRSMRDFPGKVFSDADLKTDRMNLYEIFINMYLREVRNLVKRGIRSAYVRQEDNLHYYKGKLLVSRQIRENLAHKERFCVSYDVFHPDRPENRLIKATLQMLQRETVSAENAREIRQLLTAFELVTPSVNYQKDFSAVVLDRNTKDYEMLMQWSRIFLMHKSFTTFSGHSPSRALLFPMERVYESYVGRHMKRIMGTAGWEVSCQDKGCYLFEEPRRQFALRPDIVLQKDERTVILDTKWKRLIDNERRNYGISQADMYQMYAYSKKYRTSEVWLLYPMNDEMRDHSEIRFDSGDGTTVRVYFVDVAHVEDSIEELSLLLERK